MIQLRGNKELINDELAELERELECKNQVCKKKITYLDIVKHKVTRRALIVTLFLQLAQQLIGADAVSFFFFFHILF